GYNVALNRGQAQKSPENKIYRRIVEHKLYQFTPAKARKKKKGQKS
ncbi:unnamed protein product, partial [marine sediment metagenome]